MLLLTILWQNLNLQYKDKGLILMYLLLRRCSPPPPPPHNMTCAAVAKRWNVDTFELFFLLYEKWPESDILSW